MVPDVDEAGSTTAVASKPRLIAVQREPLVLETPAWLLDEDVTPTSSLFVRDNGVPPPPALDPERWSLTIDGEVERPLTLSVAALKDRFETVTIPMVLECGGNGRTALVPPVDGTPWGVGGVGCPAWTGVRLRDVLAAAGPKPSAVYTAHFGADTDPQPDHGAPPLSRGVRLEKALEPHTLLVFGLNGEPLPHIHGGPLRLVVPGWAGSASHKWLTRIWIRDREHDGPGMTGLSYRLPTVPIRPGTQSDGTGFRVLESMPVRALITSIADGATLPAGTGSLAVHGRAWAGEATVARVEVSADMGRSWTPCVVAPPPNRYAWQRWEAIVAVPGPGYRELWARATDGDGNTQPIVPDNWNPGGYGANPVHRVGLTIGS